jgi:hypothetical protein
LNPSSVGYYASSSPSSNLNFAYYLNASPSTLAPQSTQYRGAGYSLRCFKDIPDIVGTISYTTTGSTNQNVIATLTLSMTGNLLTNGRNGTGKIFTKEYTGNILLEPVVFENVYGSTGVAFATITRIDKVAPVIMLTGDNPQYIEVYGNYIEL